MRARREWIAGPGWEGPMQAHGPGGSAEGVGMSVVQVQRPGRGEAAREEARRAFGRVLAQWAGDCLRLRRAGLDRPCRREGGVSGIGWGSDARGIG